MMRYLSSLVSLGLLLHAVACGDDDGGPPAPGDGGADASPADAGPGDTGANDAGPADGGPDTGRGDAGPPPACSHPAADFDLTDTAGDGWPACSSDDGAFHLFAMSVSTFGRVAAFEEIADLLWRRPDAPSADDFLMARELYSVDGGIGSRVSRRYDAHYPACSVAEPAATSECARPGATAACPERCVGPAVIQPMILDAFMQGAMGMEPELNAARVEAALWYFFWVSAYKESSSCEETSEDCDSSIGYYRGDGVLSADGTALSRAASAAEARGISRYVIEVDPAADEAMMEANLAVRCWREMDNPTGVAMNAELHAQALDQLDRATLRALAVVLRARIGSFASSSGTARAAHWEFLRLLGPALDRGATLRDGSMATVLRTELARTDPGTVDADVMVNALDALFPCPF